MRNLFYFSITFVFFYFKELSVLSMNVEIEIINGGSGDNSNRRSRPVGIGQPFNPFDQFLNMNTMAQLMMNDLMNEGEDDFEEEKLPNDNPNAIELKDGKKTKKGGKKVTKKVTHENGVHREVTTTTMGNGIQRVEVTEIHSMGRGNMGNQFQGIPMGIHMGMPTIIIGKPRNLKMRGEEASPFKMMREMDSIFESIFESLADKLIEDQINSHTQFDNAIKNIENEMNKEKKSIDDLEVKDEHGNGDEHEGHIKVTEIKDITQESVKVKNLEIISNENNEIAEEDLYKIKIKDSIKVEEPDDPNHSLSLTHETNTQKNPGDKIMTSKEKKKQIKEEKKRLIFVKICKFVFYIIILFTVYIVGKKLLQIIGLIEEKVIENPTTSESNEKDQPSIEMKAAANIKNE